MRRVAELAQAVDHGVRRQDSYFMWECETILEELTGVRPGENWRVSVGPSVAGIVCLAKSVTALSSMLASAGGGHIAIDGLLDDMMDAQPSGRAPMQSRRPCLGCGRSFMSWGASNRLCSSCQRAAGEDPNGHVVVVRPYGRGA